MFREWCISIGDSCRQLPHQHCPRQPATCQRHMKGGLAWLAWVGFGEKLENGPARPSGHHRRPRVRRACCAGVQHVRWTSVVGALEALVHGRQADTTSRTGTVHDLSTLQHVVCLEEARRCEYLLPYGICICQCYVVVATRWHDSDGSNRASRPMTTISSCWLNLPFCSMQRFDRVGR